MTNPAKLNSESTNYFSDLIGLHISETKAGFSRCSLEVKHQLLNPHGVLHGGVTYSLADTGMGAAIYSLLDEGQICATTEIKISYFRPVLSGILNCKTNVIHKGKTLAFLESQLEVDDRMVAKALGTYSIFPKRAQRGE